MEQRYLVGLNWKKLRAINYPLHREGCEWITDQSIQDCLYHRHFEDVNAPQGSHSHHAARIASLVRVLRGGSSLEPLSIKVRKEIYIVDGSHRLRAYQFINETENIPALVWGKVEVLRDAFV